MKSIIWTVRIKAAPTVDRHCKRCGVRSEFCSSGLFRVNAQQKCLDVWLIYKCSVCGTTWNLTILSRVSPRSVPSALLNGFYGNHADLAIRYASDTSLVKRNGAESNRPEIEILGEDVNENESARIHLAPSGTVDVKAEEVLRKKLGLSRSGFDKMLSAGTLVCVSGHDLKKCKLSGEVVVELRASL